MQRRWHARVRSLTAGVAGLVLAAGPLAAQTPLSGGATSLPTQGQDEFARLFPGPKGELFRLQQSEGDQRAGGGSLLLAVAGPQDAWADLLLLRPTETGVSARDGDLAFGPGGEVAIAYRWWRQTPRSKQVRLARSDDGGKTWSQPTTSIEGSGKAFDPKVAWARDKALVVVWSDERRGNRLFDIYARRSADGGATWEPEQLLSKFPRYAPGDLHARPQLLSDGGDRLWALWVGVQRTKSFVFLSRSTDGGRTWTEPVPITGDSRSVFGHTLLRAGQRMLLVWNDTLGEPDRIFTATSSDDGVTWTTPVRVDHVPAGGPAATSASTILAPDGEVMIAWHDGRNGRDDIFLARSTDGGRTWASEDTRMDMDEPGTGISRFPKLGRAPDGRVALVWEDDRDGHEAVYLRIRSAGPKPEWGPEVLAVPAAGKLAARVPNLAWRPGGLYLSWQAWDNTRAPGGIEKRAAGRTIPLDAR